MRFLHRWQNFLVPGLITVLILWTMLLQGYILSLDLVFTPHFYLSLNNTGGFYNNYPIWYLIQFLYYAIPGWIVEKLLLIGLFFSLSFFSFNYLPVSKRFSVRLFASLLYTANTFVYVRMLAGQWTILYAYALLPLLLHVLIAFTKELTYTHAAQLAAVLALIGMCALHLFVMGVLMTVLWIVIEIGRHTRSHAAFKKLSLTTLFAVFLTFVFTSYWTIPSLFRSHPVESTFTISHWQAFAAAAHGSIHIITNLSMLGGFWGEGQPWIQYFAWPQTQPLFVLAWIVVLLLSVVGCVRLWRTQRKVLASFLLVIGLLGIILGAGVSATPFQSLNVFLYVHAPFWSGFRDSQKFIALLALSYAILSAYGFAYVTEKIRQSKFVKSPEGYVYYVLIPFFLIPALFGMFVWGGFAKQLKPVEFPDGWARAGTELAANPTAKVLILPWQGYFSLSFNNDLITANPAEQYFGPQAITSQNVRLDQVYDQSTDPAYEALDYAIRHNSPQNGETMAVFLKKQGIQYVISFQDIHSSDTFTYQFLQSPQFTLEWFTPELQFYKIN